MAAKKARVYYVRRDVKGKVIETKRRRLGSECPWWTYSRD